MNPEFQVRTAPAPTGRVPESQARRVTLAVPVFNKIDLLRPSLESIVRSARAHGAVEIVLVDNGSTDGSYELAERFAAGHADIVQLHRRAGSISHIRNWGARQGSAPYICFLDSDIVVPDDYFDRVEALFHSGVAEAVGCECHLPDDPSWVERVWFDLTVRKTDGYRHYLNSGSFAMTRRLFDRVGGFPEDFQTGEDTELGYRIIALGERIYQSQTVATKHLGNSKTVAAFYRRMRWHGFGVTDGRTVTLKHRYTQLMLVNLALIVASVALLLIPTPLPIVLRLAIVAALLLAVPLFTYAFRVLQVRRLVNLPASLLLIEVLYFARASAFWTVLTRLRGARDSTRAPGIAVK